MRDGGQRWLAGWSRMERVESEISWPPEQGRGPPFPFSALIIARIQLRLEWAKFALRGRIAHGFRQNAQVINVIGALVSLLLPVNIGNLAIVRRNCVPP